MAAFHSAHLAAFDRPLTLLLVYAERAVDFKEKKEFGRAIQELTIGITSHRRDTGYLVVLLLRGSLYSKCCEYDSAIADFTEVMKEWPTKDGELCFSKDEGLTQRDYAAVALKRAFAYSQTGRQTDELADLKLAARYDRSVNQIYLRVKKQIEDGADADKRTVEVLACLAMGAIFVASLERESAATPADSSSTGSWFSDYMSRFGGHSVRELSSCSWCGGKGWSYNMWKNDSREQCIRCGGSGLHEEWVWKPDR